MRIATSRVMSKTCNVHVGRIKIEMEKTMGSTRWAIFRKVVKKCSRSNEKMVSSGISRKQLLRLFECRRDAFGCRLYAQTKAPKSHLIHFWTEKQTTAQEIALVASLRATLATRWALRNNSRERGNRKPKCSRCQCHRAWQRVNTADVCSALHRPHDSSCNVLGLRLRL